MSYYREYSRPAVTSNGCSYASLQGYNQAYYGTSVMAPVPVSAPSMSTVVVPSFGAPGYDVLMHSRDNGANCTWAQKQGCHQQCRESCMDAENKRACLKNCVGDCQSTCPSGTCSGYFEKSRAYPDYPNNCSRYTSRLCN